MPDEFFARSEPLASLQGGRATSRRGTSLRAVLGVTLLAFIGGAILIAYLVWDGKIHLVNQTTSAPAGEQSAARLTGSGANSVDANRINAIGQQIAALDQRLTRIDAQAAAAEGQTARAEALLVAAAARRTIERGAPLGYLADQLKARFADTQPRAVQTLLDASRNPVTLGQLAGQLDALAPRLTDAPAANGGWDQFRNQVAALFVIHREDAPAARPEDRLNQARAALRSGQADAAAAEVARLPGGPAAAAWISQARRYAAAQRALDLIDAAALQGPVEAEQTRP